MRLIDERVEVEVEVDGKMDVVIIIYYCHCWVPLQFGSEALWACHVGWVSEWRLGCFWRWREVSASRLGKMEGRKEGSERGDYEDEVGKRKVCVTSYLQGVLDARRQLCRPIIVGVPLGCS